MKTEALRAWRDSCSTAVTAIFLAAVVMLFRGTEPPAWLWWLAVAALAAEVDIRLADAVEESKTRAQGE